jgi:hypothetical protein
VTKSNPILFVTYTWLAAVNVRQDERPDKRPDKSKMLKKCFNESFEEQ